MTDAVAKKSYLVLAFTQNGTTLWYTNWSGGWSSGSDVATVVQSITARLMPNSGGFTDLEMEIDLQAGDDATGWLDDLADGGPKAPVTVSVKLGLVPFGPGETETEELVELGTYRLFRSLLNAQQEKGRIRFGFRDHRGMLHSPLGIPMTPTCAWALGDKSCQVDTAAAEETVTVEVVSRKKMTITGADVAVVTGQPDYTYWERGYVTFESLSVGIRTWDGAGDVYDFHLVHDVPVGWVGETVTLTPGCDKTPATCASRWSNLEQIGCFGIAIPRHHLVTELPS